jgi:hypothetical protein
MRKSILAVMAAVSLLGASAASGAQAAPTAQLIFAPDRASDMPVLEKAQYYWGGRHYCWYDGWNGPGYYWCGYGWRSGFGWGGGYGWRGWGGGYRGGGHGGGYYHGGGGHGGGAYYHGGGGHGGGHGGGDHHH